MLVLKPGGRDLALGQHLALPLEQPCEGHGASIIVSVSQEEELRA